MNIQHVSKHQREEHGEHCVRVVMDRAIGPAMNTLDRLRNTLPRDYEVGTPHCDGYGRVAYVFCNSVEEKREVELAIMGEDGIQRRIDNIRWWVALHSHIYYDLGEAVVSDEGWDRKARRLAKLQEVHGPHAGSWFNEQFKGFTGDTGYHLPTTPALEKQAQELIEKQNSGDDQ